MVAIAGPGWTLAPSLKLYVDQADRAFPGRDYRSDGSIGDQAHANRDSDHNPYAGFVHAIDLDEDLAPGLDLKGFAELLRREILVDLAAGRRPRIRYLIYEGRTCKSYASNGHAAGEWQDYTGENDHLGHLHLSIDRTDAARNDLRAWPFAGAPTKPKPPARGDDEMLEQIVTLIDDRTPRKIEGAHVYSLVGGTAKHLGPGALELRKGLARIAPTKVQIVATKLGFAFWQGYVVVDGPMKNVG